MKRIISHCVYGHLLVVLAALSGDAFAATAGLAAPGSPNLPNAGMREIRSDAVFQISETQFSTAVFDQAHGIALFGGFTSPANVVKVSLGGPGIAPVRIGGLSLTGNNYLYCSGLDAVNGIALFGRDETPGAVVKIALGAPGDSPTSPGGAAFLSNEAGALSMVLDAANGVALVASLTNAGGIVKVALNAPNAAPSRVGVMAYVAGETSALQGGAVFDAANGVALFGNSGELIKVAVNGASGNPTRVGTATLMGNETAGFGQFDAASGTALFSTQSTPGIIVKAAVNGPTGNPSRVGALTLNTGENYPRAGVYDASAGVAVFLGQTGTAPAAFKIGLGAANASPVRLGSLTFSAGIIQFDAPVLDSNNALIYFYSATSTANRLTQFVYSPKSVLAGTKVVLADTAGVTDVHFFSHAAAGNLRLAIYDAASDKNLIWQSPVLPNTGAGAEVVVPISAGTPSALKLAPGTYYFAWQTDSTASVPSYTPGSGGDGFVAFQSFGAYPSQIAAANQTATAERYTEYITYGVYAQPVLASAAAAVPSSPGVGQPVSFSAAVNSYPGAALSYSWTFGDGSVATGASVMHAYSAAGPYTATVTVSDGVGGTTSGTAQVTVKTPLLGTGNDSDGDGFSDAFETAAGTNPQDPASTPFGGLSASNASELTLAKATIALNFAKTNADSIKFSGSVVVPANFVVSGAKVYLAIGNVLQAFTLDSKGSSKLGTDTLKISIKAKKGVVSAQTAKFSASLSKGSFAAQLADSGLTGDADVKAVPRMVPFTLEFNGSTLQKVQTMSYTAKKGKSGAAK